MYNYPNSAFYGMTQLTKVTFSEGMRTIPYRALLDCSTVTEVVLPESITAISSEAFNGCSALATINLPDGITSIGSSAFYGCASLASVDIPDKLVTIGASAFENCSKIDAIVLPETLTTMEAKAFSGTKIAEIVVPAGVTSMYDYPASALYGMNYLEKVTFADGMKAVPRNAILNCDYLKEVVIYDCNESLEAMKTTAESNDFTLTVLPCSGCHHRTTEIRNTVAATCSANGYTGDTCCKDCGVILEKGSETEKTAHTFGNWTLVKNPTITEEGMEERKCSVCDETETRAVAKIEYLIGDVNGDGKITAADARIVLRVSAKLEKFENYNRPFEVFDIISDGKITAADARKILRISARLE